MTTATAMSKPRQPAPPLLAAVLFGACLAAGFVMGRAWPSAGAGAAPRSAGAIAVSAPARVAPPNAHGGGADADSASASRPHTTAGWIALLREAEQLDPDSCTEHMGDNWFSRQVVADMPVTEFARVFRRLDIHSGGIGNLAVLLPLWAELEPAAARAFIRATVAQNKLAPNVAASLLAGWAVLDPTAAADYALARFDTLGWQFGLRDLAAAWAQTDLPGALAKLQSLPSGLPRTGRDEPRTVFLCGVLNPWLKADPEAACRYAAAFLTGREADTVASVLGEAWAEADPRAGVRWAQTCARPGVRNRILDSCLSALAKTAPAEAAALAEALPLSDSRRGTLVAVACAWADKDADAACAWAGSLPDGPGRTEALRKAAQALGRTDKARAAKLLFDLDTVSVLNPIRVSRTYEFVAGWAHTEPQAALAWVQALPPGRVKDEFLASLLPRTVSSPAELRALIAREPPGELRNGLVRQLVVRCATTPAALSDLWPTLSEAEQEAAVSDGVLADSTAFAVAQQPGGLAALAGQLAGLPTPVRVEYAATIARKWVDLDPAQAVAWAQGLSDEATRDRAANTLVESWSSQSAEDALRVEPEKLLALSVRLADNGVRANVIHTALAQWLKIAPDTARAWIAKSALPADEKKKLLEPKDEPAL